MKCFLLVVSLYGCIHWTLGQPVFNFGCPNGWRLHGTKCYKFADDEAIVYEEADTYCWSFGAKLVSVETFTENKFINDWLMINDILRESLWYTSGEWFRGRVYWEATKAFQDTDTFWIRQPEFSPFNEIKYRIIYKYGNEQARYGWSNVTSSSKGFPICEILRTDAISIDVLDRDFDYGLGTEQPGNIGIGPVIEIHPGNIVMIEGAKSVEFDCFATGNPLPNYEWHYGLSHNNASQLASSQRRTLSGSVLTISEPVEQDVGSYHCRASNEHGVVLSDSAKMIMGFLGHFQNIDPQPVYATVFKGAKMECGTPSYNPGVTYQWFKNAATNIFVWPSNGNMFVSYSGALYVSEVQPTDANKRYFCTVTLVATDGYKMAKAFAPSRLNLGLLLRLSSDGTSDNDYGPILNTHAFPTPALRGRKIRLECVAYGTGTMTYSWSREDGRDFVPGTEISALGRVLEIPNAPISAEGNYICSCRRASGTTASKIISVFVETKPYFPYSIKNMLVDPNMDITWNCRAVARPTATYSWYKNGKLLTQQPGKITIRSNVLEIKKVSKKDDEGMYQCAATNQHGTSFSTGQLKVLSFPPNFNRFPLPEQTLTATGSNISIPCKVEAAPIPAVEWLKNGGGLNVRPGDFSGRVGMDTRYSLVITGVEFSDQGVYTCKATNSMGEASGTTRLMVVEGARLTQFPAPQTVQVNRTAFFYCQAAYTPNSDLTYIWKFNGRTIDFKMNPEYVSGRRQGQDGLYVINSQFKHQGIYECEARTTMGADSAFALLTVVGPPRPPAGVYADDFTVTARSVRLLWTVADNLMNTNAPISAYDIEAESNYKPGLWKTVSTDVQDYVANNEAINAGKRTDQRAIVVENLIPNTSYRFRIRGINLYGRGQEASAPSKQVRISATKPVLAPRNVGGGGGTVGALTMTWETLDISEYCGPGIGYRVYWKKMDDAKDWKKETANDDMALNEGKFVATVGEDNYYLQYQVKVAAFNDLGDGPNSSVVFIYSAMGMPTAVPITMDTDAVNGTAVIVNWVPVPDNRDTMKGRVAGYRIHYYENPTGEYSPFVMETEPDPVVVGMVSKNVYGQMGSAMIIGLTPNCEQFVRVQVFNTAGYGPKGEWRRAETFNDALSAFPTHIEVHPHDEHSVRVRWRGISIKSNEESLQGYIIRVWKVQEDVRTAKDYKTDKVMEAEIGGLQKHTVYTVRVLGYSTAGDGSLSEVVYFTVLGGSIPFDPTTSQICYADHDTRMCDGSCLYINVLLLLTLVLLSLFTR